MTRIQVASLCVVAACLGLVWPAGAAGKYDGSAPLLCAVTAISECTANGKCEPSTPQEGNNLPTFLRADVKTRLLTTADDSGRKTEIKIANMVDGQLVLQGAENGKAWNMVIQSDTGRWGGSVVEDDGLFALFGACTLP